jgi:transposase InsO family protein
MGTNHFSAVLSTSLIDGGNLRSRRASLAQRSASPWIACSRRGHGLRSITVDHGTEFMSRALEDWASQRAVQLDFIRPGKPIENAFVESFNGRLRDECLNVHPISRRSTTRRRRSKPGASTTISAGHTAHYRERNHQGLENALIEGAPISGARGCRRCDYAFPRGVNNGQGFSV